jgi:cytidyltransferase-like protein
MFKEKTFITVSWLLFLSYNAYAIRPMLNYGDKDCKELIRSIFKRDLSTQESFLTSSLLKRPVMGTLRVDLDELSSAQIVSSLINVRVKPHELSDYERYQLLKDYPIADIVTAPGHRRLRDPQQIIGLTDYIRKTEAPDFSQDKIVLNIVTNNLDQIESIDLWNAHHRLVAYMESGYKYIGDLRLENLDIFINGTRTSGVTWKHYLPASGVDWRKMTNYEVADVYGYVKEGTLIIDGSVSNYQLGSRATMKQLLKNTRANLNGKDLRVGVYMGTFDPIHEGHIELIKRAKQKMNLDEILIIPHINPVHKNPVDIRHRNSMIARRIIDMEGINLFIGNSADIIDKFGWNPFYERIVQTYGSHDISQIMGLNTYQNLHSEGAIEKATHRNFLVYAADGREIDDSLNSEKTKFFFGKQGTGDLLDKSSDEIKKAIQAGEKPPEEDLHPTVLDYIQNNALYSLER